MRRSRAALALGLLTTGCLHASYSSLPTPGNVAVSSSTAEAGRVSVDIASLNQWQDIATHFQSNYSLTGQNALALVNRASTYENGALVENNGVGLSVSANGPIINNDASRSTTTSTDTTGTKTSTSTSSASRDSRQATPDAISPAALPAGGAVSGPFSGQTPNLAPIVNYQSADSLFKYAAVLDQGFGNMTPCGYIPVLVTFRITVSANKRNQPYDTVVDLSVSPRRNIGKTPSDPRYQLLRNGGKTEGGEASDPLGCGYDIRDDDVSIVSFSSDSLENGQSDMLAQQTKALALAAALRGGVGAASANFQSLATAIDHNLFLRPNSLVSVARAGNNTLHIRLGADRFGVDTYEMLSLDHQVSIVLMVPYQDVRRDDLLKAVGHYYFEDARGLPSADVKPMRDADAAWLNTRAQYMHDVALTEEADFPAVAGTLPAVTGCAASVGNCGSLENVSERLADISQSEFNFAIFGIETLDARQYDLSDDLKARLSKYALRPGITTATRALPVSPRACPLRDVTLSVSDDGTNATATISGADGFQGSHITARLNVWKVGPAGAKLSPTSVAASLDAGGPDIGDVKFPSVAARFGPKDKLAAELDFWGRDSLACPAGGGEYAAVYSRPGAAKTANKAGATAASTPRVAGVSNYPAQINVVNGAGNIGFSLSLTDAKASTVDVSTDTGAQLVAISGVSAVGGKVTLTKDGDYAVDLKNIAVGKAFYLVFAFKSGGKQIAKYPIKIAVTKGA